METEGDARRVSLKIHHILILVLHFPTVINCSAAHGIMFSKRLMVLINRGLDLGEKKYPLAELGDISRCKFFPSKILILAMYWKYAFLPKCLHHSGQHYH